MNYYSKKFFKNPFNKILISTLLLTLIPFNLNAAKAFEFQWDSNDGYKKLKWFQKTAEKNAKNKIYLFFMPRDRRTGLLSINIKIPKNFKSTLKPKNITFCKANFGGFTNRTECIENIPSDFVIDKETKRLEIYPITPVPADKDKYAVVLKINNPRKSGLYQFHSFGKSSGPVPVSNYIGSWTVNISP
tara:strand:- start:155 stop:718 length:564 start_codon:yes stop_codon:yes gene_type:complete